jgi:hypothetical protein
MYIVAVAALLLVLPVSFILGDASIAHVQITGPLIQKWFVFWSVGVRLCLAGLRQMLQPDYTAKVILSLKGEEASFVVRELGIANFSIGAVGLTGLWISSWRSAGALAGVVFYALAGVNHLRHRERGRLQNVAMASDLLVAVVLLVASVSTTLAH